jgi:hypothetical protein
MVYHEQFFLCSVVSAIRNAGSQSTRNTCGMAASNHCTRSSAWLEPLRLPLLSVDSDTTSLFPRLDRGEEAHAVAVHHALIILIY